MAFEFQSPVRSPGSAWERRHPAYLRSKTSLSEPLEIDDARRQAGCLRSQDAQIDNSFSYVLKASLYHKL
jgi:hypothetical protein